MLMLQNDQVLGGVAAALPARQRPHWSEVLAHPVRSFHTVRHLEPKQLVYRAVRLVQPSAIAGGEGDGALRVRRASPAASMPDPAFDGRSFSFLNRRLPWGGPDRWHPQAADDLWIFNLHYFRYLADVDASVARELILDWIAANRQTGGAAWHPYTISIRVREWMEWLLAHPDAPEPLATAMIGSIREQVNQLSHRLEFQVMGNHLLENAITLCWAGLSFADRQSEAWLAEGAAVLFPELRRQVLADGSHDERSPMYQAVLTESLLRLAEVAGDAPGATAAAIHDVARDCGRQMLESLHRMTHPDGAYALLNDTAGGIAPSLNALVDRFAIGGEIAAARPSGRGWSLPDAGYSGYRAGDDMYVVFDAGPIGPDHQPGHGHADMLSFELSARGRRVVTDTGVFTYACGTARRHDRSTAAHNTIEIDGRDQSEVWGAFRCGRRSSIVAAGADESRDGIMLSGAYRGKGRRGAGTVRHQRQLFVNRRLLAFTDTVTAAGQHDATLRLHLAPGTHIKRSGGTCIVIDGQRRPMATLAGDGVDWIESSSPYHPQFGIETTRPCLIARAGFRDRLVVKWWLILN